MTPMQTFWFGFVVCYVIAAGMTFHLLMALDAPMGRSARMALTWPTFVLVVAENLAEAREQAQRRKGRLQQIGR